MQKISSYLYPNRIEVLANIFGNADQYGARNVEYTNVYQRQIKIYNGIDNIIEFDIKNADQKRIDLSQFEQIQMNVMDASGQALRSSPYTVTPSSGRGLATVTIPYTDLVNLQNQYLQYSLIAIQDDQDVLLYCDSRFGALGTVELVTNVLPIKRKNRIFTTFTGEIDLKGIPTDHSSAIPTKFYEAIPSTKISCEIHVTGFIGSIWIDATTNSTINAEAWRKAGKPFGSWTQRVEDGPYTGIVPYGANLTIGDYNYIRVSYECPTIMGVGAGFIVTRNNNVYDVKIKSGGTGYSTGGTIKVPGDQLGGVRGINDLLISVVGIDGSTAGFTSSYSVSSVSSIIWSGVAADGTGTNIVTGTNVAGTVDKVIVS